MEDTERDHQTPAAASKEHADFEFNLRELAGSMGDFGTLFPLAIGFIAVNGIDPAGLFIVMGLTNIALGLIYRLPMPLEPKKVVAATAISQEWPPALIHASALGLGLIWFLLVITGLLRRIVSITPRFLVRGIQIALGVILGWRALQMMAPAPLLGVLAVALVLLLRGSRYAPATLVLMALGVGIMAWRGELQLMLNMGAMNVIGSFFGGMPMCHGAQGLAGQYYFGARTGGTPILEGLVEISMGLFLSRSIANILTAFPMPLIGGMMFMVAGQLGKEAVKLRGWKLGLAATTAAVSVVTNMAVGFVVGLGLTYLLRTLARRGAGPGFLSDILPDEELLSDE